MGGAAPVRLKGNSWLLPGPTNLGLVETAEGVILVDSGNDKEAGRGVLKLLRERDWTLRAIVNTHSNADHIGGNRYLQETTNCEIWATRGEAAFIETPELEGAFLWGGFPYRDLDSKFFLAKPSRVTAIVEAGGEREGLRFVGLRGHFLDMIGVLSGDGVLYAADGLFGEKILEKHRIPYIYDVRAYREGLARIAATEAEFYVPSHGEVLSAPGSLVALNLAKVDEIEERLLGLLVEGGSFEELLARLCDGYGIELDKGRYVLMGNTLRSFLAYLEREGRAEGSIEGNRMTWKARGGGDPPPPPGIALA